MLKSPWLTAQGCTRFQGYYFGRPMGAGAITERLAAQLPAVAEASVRDHS